MANRSFVRNTMSLEKNPCQIYVNATIGSSGAVTLNSTKSLGVYSMTHDSTGVYSIKLGFSSTSLDTYQRLMDMSVASISSAPAWYQCFVTSDASATASAPKIVIKFRDAAGTAVDPASGEVLLIRMSLSNTTAL